MSLFPARLHLPGQSKLPLSVEVDVSNEWLSVTSGDRPVANLSLETLEVSQSGDGFHIVVDNEEMVLKVADSGGFAEALGVAMESKAGRHANNDSGINALLNPESMAHLRYEELKGRVAAVRETLMSDLIPPAVAFAKWLYLLKELNRRHGQGNLDTHRFYELNSEALDLMSNPRDPKGTDEGPEVA